MDRGVRIRIGRGLALALLLAGGMALGKAVILLKADADRTVLEEAAKQAKSIPGVAPRIEEGDGGYRLVLGPLPSDEETAALYYHLKKVFPSAVIIEKGEPSREKSGQIGEWPPGWIPGSVSGGASEEEEYRLWIALFALAVTGVLALFVSSKKMQRLEARHERIRKRHEEIERRFNDLFHRLGENIYRLSKDIVRFTNNIVEEVEDQKVEEKLKRVVHTESRILDVTTNLLDFLRLKAKKVVIRKDRFDINSVLEDVVESIVCEKDRLGELETELIFDIDKEIPKYIVGDFVHIGEVLSKLLENALERAAGTEVKLEVKVYRPFTGKMELQFKITYFPYHDNENLEEYFIPHYDERLGEYRRLGCFVAHELIQLMEGTATVARNSRLNQIIVDLTVPVESAEGEERRKYRLDRREYIRKNVLIVNRNYDASLASKEMFSYFRHQVRVMDAEKFETRRPPLEEFDILVIDEALISALLSDYVRKIRRHKELKVVGLRNLFAPIGAPFDPELLDVRETKPLNFKRVLTLINTLYGIEIPEEEEPVEAMGAGRSCEIPPREFWDDIPAAPRINLESFRDFSGSTVLVVEDNEINLKMMLSVLGVSGIHVLSARNGEEAVRIMEGPDGREVQMILMDINMPVMDGLTAAGRIRQLPQGREVPIVALSALNLESELERMRKAEMDGYLPKPLNIGRLYALFERYLRRSSVPVTEVEAIEAPRLEGIDMEEALQRTHGNEILLKEILQEFLEAYGESDKTLRQLYEKGDYLNLRQLTLDILGLTGTIGAKELHRISKEMYKLQLYSKMDLLPNYLIEYEVAMAKVRRSLKNYLERSGREGVARSSSASNRGS
jgi:CheY-like chemotaxis protein